MNSLIILPGECVDGTCAVLTGQRALYAHDTHGVRAGQVIKVGILGGLRGEGRILESSPQRVAVELKVSQPCLAPRPIDLIVGVSRPQTIKKVVQAAVMFGARSLHFVRSERGDKSYLQSTSLSEESLQEEAIKALEQVWDTRVVPIVVHRSFGHFCAAKLPLLEDGRAPLKLLAHPIGEGLRSAFESPSAGGAIVAIGPERGWSEGEVGRLQSEGFSLVGLGERVVRVELALTFLLGQLDVLMQPA